MKKFIINLAKESGKIALNHLNNATITEKSHKNVVTDADLEIDKYIRNEIIQNYPNHNIITEENYSIFNDSEYTWYIDPIDGTSNYSHSDPNFAIVIALAKNGQVINSCVYMPVFDELYYAELNQGTELNGEKVNVTNVNEIKNAMKSASLNELKGILGYCDDLVVSQDFIGDKRTSIFDANAGMELNSKFFKIISWYDNECGYSNKLLDLAKHVYSI